MPRPSALPILAVLAFVSACDRGEVEVRRVPKSQNAPADAAASETPEQRLLGAIVPDGPSTWFFKLIADAPAVTAQVQSFDALVKSLKLGAGEKPVAWTLPAGWTESPGSDMRYATLIIEKGVEVSVTKLDGAAGGVLANVNRWRNQLGLAPISDVELTTTCPQEQVNGKTVVRVDLRGHAKAGGPPMMAGSAGNAPPAANPGAKTASGTQMPAIDSPAPTSEITYSRPPEWKEKPATPPRLANFDVGDAELVITAFPGDVGGELMNVNRWRNQVGLDPIDAAGIAAALRTVKAGDLDARCFYFEGKELAISAGVLKHEDMSWFVKLTGPIATVSKERTHFDEFVSSVRFTSGDK